MKLSIRRLSFPLIFAFLAIACSALTERAEAAEGRSIKVPHNAFSKVARDDLAAELRQMGEIRVIVGLQTPSEIAQAVDTTPDQTKEQRVALRQLRVLERLAGYSLRNVKRLRHHDFMAMTVDAAALTALLAQPDVTSVTEDRPVYPVLYDTPGITRADRAWSQGYRGAGQAVAIIDTGVDKTHPFFSGKVVAEACFSRPAPGNQSYCPGGAAQSIGAGSGAPCADSSLGCWHGTHVAGIAAGGYGILSSATGGVAPDASVIAIQVFQRSCSGSSCSIAAYDSDLIAALDHVYSLRNTYSIASVNMSLGGDVYTAQCDNSLPAYKTIITNLRNANIATVIASGNDGNAGAISAPACVSNAISVGSTTKSNTVSSFSNSASFLSLLAPGSSITSSTPGGGFGGASGTSMATPHVAGAWAVLKQAKPTATVSEVLTALQSTGLPISDTRNGVVKPLIQIGATASSVGAIGALAGLPPTVTLTSPANNVSLPAPATVNLSATAADPDGAVSKVEFYRSAALIATVTAPTSGNTYTFSDPNLPAGTYSYTARVYDNATPAAVTTSAAALVSVTATSAGSVNVAAQANGGVANASSVRDTGHAAAHTINGDRKGLNWGSTGGWGDATGTFPDTLQINFSSTQSIGEINVFSVQDNYKAPIEPTPSMTFTQYGLTTFQVQYWNGSAWLDVPGGNISGNNLIWRRFSFAPITTNAIRVLVHSSADGATRITEVEAWTANGGGPPPNSPPTVALTSPSNNTMLSAPATVNLSATATDPDGAVSKVEFYRSAALIATVTAPTSGNTYTFSDPNLPAGTYSYTARVYDNATPAAVTTSAAALVSVTATSAGSVNVAAQANGGVANASSVRDTGHAAAHTINGDRKGLNWGSTGGWGDATGTFPDTLQINFSSTQSIGEINVFSVQDNYKAPIEPTPSMTFTQYGLTAFQVQYWNGSAWLDVPGGNISGNNLIWRRFSFAPITTNAIRVLVHSSADGATRITEVEAWTANGGGPPPNSPPTVALTSPSNNTMLSAPATVNLSATATDPDGAVSKVEFYRSAALIATVTAPTSGNTYTFSDPNLPAGTYSYTARVYDNATPAAVTTSAAALVSVTATSAGSVNVAAQANGGVANASSVRDTGHAAAHTINGDRKGLNWGSTGGWGDATGTFPDTLQINFSSTQSIGEINVFSVQDNYKAPIEPTPSMTFTQYGLTAFQVQYWNGSAWLDVPGGNISGNNLIWRRFSFAPITTNAIRVLVHSSADGATRITEVEAWTIASPNSTPAPPIITLQSVASGLTNPVGIENAADGSGRLFIVQLGGQIKIVSSGGVMATPFLDIGPLLVSGDERGLLGIAFHPNYTTNGLFYVNYTRQGDGATVVARYQRSNSNPNIAEPSSGLPLLITAQPFANHKGGQLRFGPDGYLYIALGDGGSGNDPGNRAQNLSNPLGKMLRIDVNNGSPYTIPATNPFQNDGNSTTLGEIWAYGLRNPWRFSFDRLTGDLFIADVGQNAREEINFQEAGNGGGTNYGWRVMEGSSCTGLGGGPPCFDTTLTSPILEYSHAFGCSVTGGYRYRGSASPALTGYFIYGDFCSGRIWGATRHSSGFWDTTQLTSAGFNISTFGEDEAGEIYVGAYDTGAIYRISTSLSSTSRYLNR